MSLKFSQTWRKRNRKPVEAQRAMMESLDSRTLLSGDVITATPATITPTEGQAANAVTVATFTDSIPSNTSSFSATIDWGDGSAVDDATITLDGSGNFYDVVGTHAYAHAGHDAIVVSIDNDVSGSTAPANSSANVANAALAATGVSLNATEGTALGGSSVLASFTDANASASAADFTATITWDTGATTSAQVVANGNGGFDVVGSHRYDSAGDKSVIVNIAGVGGGTAQANSTVHVSDAALTTTGVHIRVRNYKTLTRSVATFTDANLFDVPASFRALMYIGRHAHRGVACRIISTGNGSYSVAGTFRFSAAGTYPVRVVILDAGGSVASANSTVTAY